MVVQAKKRGNGARRPRAVRAAGTLCVSGGFLFPIWGPGTGTALNALVFWNL